MKNINCDHLFYLIVISPCYFFIFSYRKFATKVDESLRFMKAIGVDTSTPTFSQVDFYVAHECLLLPYEEALTRLDSTTGRYYDCSGHMLWVGERTRQMDGAHLEFVRGIGNPLGVKISDKCSPEELIRIIETMNPQNIPGRLSIIVRMGAEKLRKNLPGLIRAVQREGKSVLWISDPVHGNTYKTDSGIKTRSFDKIRDELRAFFDVHDEMGSHPGGVHLEMTGEDVTECTGGMSGVTEATLPDRYQTFCDPRLNGAQALELAFLIAERMRMRTGLPSIE
jgi:3-deoxy-7-phosphoheptulonate synthase